MDTLLTIPKDIFVITLSISFLLGMCLGSTIIFSIYLSRLSKLFK